MESVTHVRLGVVSEGDMCEGGCGYGEEDMCEGGCGQ